MQVFKYGTEFVLVCIFRHISCLSIFRLNAPTNRPGKNSVFGHFSYLSVFSPNVGKYGPEKTPYLDTFHAVDAKLCVTWSGW